MAGSLPFAKLAGPLDVALAAGPDPAARVWASRLVDAGAGAELTLPADSVDAVVALGATLLAQSPYLAAMLVREPRLLGSLAVDPYLRREKPAGVLRDALLESTSDARDAAALAVALRRFRIREYLRLGAREAGYGSPVEVGRELAALADAAFEAAVEWHAKQLARRAQPLTAAGRRCRFVVMGMGKLGGEELNFSSDVDVLYLYETDDGAAGADTLREHFGRLSERVTRSIGDVTEDGFVFRVDLRLRPEGTQGPLCCSLEAAERYYEAFGRMWERQAWLKARPIAGDLALGAEVLRVLEPFVFPRTTSVDVITHVRGMRREIAAQAGAREAARALTGGGGEAGARARGFDLKLGDGGIREIEFFTQALQMLHAGKRPQLRQRGTLRALDRLLFAGLVSEREHRALTGAYVFLRKLEHRVQMAGGLQTHRLPDGAEAIAVLARRLGYADEVTLTVALDRVRADVRQIYATLRDPEADGDEVPAAVRALLEPRRHGAELHEALAELGFQDLEGAAFELELARAKPASPLAPDATGAAARVAPVLLEEISRSPDPDLALRHTVDLIGRRAAQAGTWRLLDDSRPVLRLVVSLLGTSDFLAKLFLAHPDLLDQLLLAGHSEPLRSRAALAADARTRATLQDGHAFEAVANALRRFKHEEILRIGLHDVAGALEPEDVAEQITDVADIVVDETLRLVTRELGARALDPHGAPVRLAVIGLGKLGARELGYASDLDVIFVYDAPPGVDLEVGERAARLAQRLIGALGALMEDGRAYEVDTRLRPSGRMGTLVSSLAALREYHAREAQLWERQALIKARAVAGDPGVGAAVEALCREVVYGAGAAQRPDAATTAAEIARLRARMEREIAREQGARVNFKSGRGGLVDIEFIAQLLQLVHGPTAPALRVRTAREALAAALELGLLAPDDHAVLDDAYRFLRQLEARLRIVQDRSLSELSLDDAPEMEKLARRMAMVGKNGESPGAALRIEYLAQTQRVRTIYERMFPPT